MSDSTDLVHAVAFADLFSEEVLEAAALVGVAASLPMAVMAGGAFLLSLQIPDRSAMLAVAGVGGLVGAVIGFMTGLSLSPVVGAVVSGVFGLLGGAAAALTSDQPAKLRLAGTAMAAVVAPMFLVNYSVSFQRVEIEAFNFCMERIADPEVGDEVLARLLNYCSKVKAFGATPFDVGVTRSSSGMGTIALDGAIVSGGSIKIPFDDGSGSGTMVTVPLDELNSSGAMGTIPLDGVPNEAPD